MDNWPEYLYLSLMDAYSGYSQIPMYPEDEEKIAFITEKGTYRYRMIPFRATYHKMMSLVFGDILERQWRPI